jgi:hypothetical protein
VNAVPRPGTRLIGVLHRQHVSPSKGTKIKEDGKITKEGKIKKYQKKRGNGKETDPQT